MLENKLPLFDNPDQSDRYDSRRVYSVQYNTALNQFRSTLLKGSLFRLKSKIQRSPQALYDLNSLKPDLHVRGSFYSGIRVVKISSIIGSEGKTTDFDIHFHPINEASRQRWVNMAMVYLSRQPLPPVQLIQVGDKHFVRDGHHRISVSRAFGQIAVDAEVVTWNAAGPFPWQADAISKERVALEELPLST